MTGTEGTKLSKNDVADMIAEALIKQKIEDQPVGIERDLAELDEVMKQIELYSPLVESYGPKIIAKTGPAFRAVMGAMFKEMMPVLIPVIRREAKVMANEFVSEYFRQLKAYTEEQLKTLPKILDTTIGAMTDAIKKFE